MSGLGKLSSKHIFFYHICGKLSSGFEKILGKLSPGLKRFVELNVKKVRVNRRG